jgi:hypothetical protein
MRRWLMVDHGFGERTASMSMGMSIESEIAYVVDPNFTVSQDQEIDLPTARR